MAFQDREIERIKTTTPPHVIKIDLDYHKGRGYVLSVIPVEEKPDGTFTWVITKGARAVVEKATRFSAKRLGQLAESVKTLPIYQETIAKVAAQENLTAVTEA